MTDGYGLYEAYVQGVNDYLLTHIREGSESHRNLMGSEGTLEGPSLEDPEGLCEFDPTRPPLSLANFLIFVTNATMSDLYLPMASLSSRGLLVLFTITCSLPARSFRLAGTNNAFIFQSDASLHWSVPFRSHTLPSMH